METMNPKIFDYLQPTEYLLACLDYLKAKNPSYSLRKWALDLGFKTPGYLSNIVSGKKKITTSFINRVATQFDLNIHEYRYFETIAKYHYADSDKEKEVCLNQLVNLQPKATLPTLDLDKFKVIKEWYHIPIMEMTRLTNFKEDYRAISRKLSNKVSPEAVELAIGRLLRLNLLERKDGKLVKTNTQLFIGNDLPNDSIRSNHLQHMNLSLSKLKNNNCDLRDYSGITVAIRKDNIPELKQAIKNFQEEILRLGGKGTPDNLYQVNIQAFNLLNQIEE